MEMRKSSLAVLLAVVVVAATVQADVPITDKDLETEESMWSLYERWRSVYSSSSSSGDLAEKVSRFEVFKKNARYIHDFNKKEGNTYKLGLNKFADLTLEEFTAKYTGAKPGTAGSSGARASIKPLEPVAGDAPPTWDWREHGAVTRVKDQGQCGSCWAFSVVGAVEGNNAIMTGNLLTLSEQQVLDCSGAGDCNGGYTYYAFDYAVSNGITLDQCYSPPPDPYFYYPKYEAAQDTCRFDPGVFTGACGTALNHAVLLVGYGVTEDGTLYWIVKNSWSTEWGENGYVRMIRNIPAPEGICGIAMYPIYPTKSCPCPTAAASAAA
uniref:Uncharacterized protein n=1 Tax=Oryza barthii TaxID=65489 RepID=A0A0D3HA48_9ORYZ